MTDEGPGRSKTFREIHNERCFNVANAKTVNPAFPPLSTVWYATGREALVALIRVLNLDADSVVLLPTFVPQGVIAPFCTLGVRVQQYRLTAGLEPDWTDLERLLSHDAPALAVLIHYFGIPQDLERFANACRRHGTLVLEDRAHLMHFGDVPLGGSADFVLYSLPKLVGVPDAAPLVIRNDTVSLGDFEYRRDPRHLWYVGAEVARIAMSTLTRRVRRRPRLWKAMRFGLRFTVSYRMLMTYFHRPTRATPLSRWLLARIDWKTEIQHRRALEERYEQGLDRGVFRRWPRRTRIETCGMGYPVCLDDRDEFVEQLRHHGIHGVWFERLWSYLDMSDRANADAVQTIRTHFLFPTARSLSLSEVDRVIAVANRWAAERQATSVIPPAVKP